MDELNRELQIIGALAAIGFPIVAGAAYLVQKAIALRFDILADRLENIASEMKVSNASVIGLTEKVVDLDKIMAVKLSEHEMAIEKLQLGKFKGRKQMGSNIGAV